MINVISDEISVYQGEIRQNLQTPDLNINILIIHAIKHPLYNVIPCHLLFKLLFVEF